MAAKDDFMERASRHQMNPAVGRAREKARAALGGKVGGGKSGAQKAGLSDEEGKHSPDHEAATAEHIRAHGPVKSHSVTKHDDGTAHVVAHHADGHAHVHEHPHIGSAQSHADHMMAASGDAAGDGEKPIQNALEEEPEDTPQEGQAEAEGECPECGAAMKDGACEQCGYEAGSAEHTGDKEHQEV